MIDELMVQQQVSNKWQHMVGVICLNCTNRRQVKKVLPNFFERWDTAEKFLLADYDDVKDIVRSLGMVNVRTKRLFQMSKDFLTWDQVDAQKLHGIGKYGSDSYEIFYNNKIPSDVKDKELLKYIANVTTHSGT
tara:strand:+ start:725 stop:1126 length:402 start_codon:yes stop_codon:yes gene_type:complete